MPCTVFANGRGVVHQTSDGMSPVFPDVCKTPTPGGPVPVPYPNIGKAADTSLGPTSVTANGSMPMTKTAKYRMTSGDEAGTLGGVISSTFIAEAEFSMYSFDVKFEGNNVCRLGDPLLHNKKNAFG